MIPAPAETNSAVLAVASRPDSSATAGAAVWAGSSPSSDDATRSVDMPSRLASASANPGTDAVATSRSTSRRSSACAAASSRAANRTEASTQSRDAPRRMSSFSILGRVAINGLEASSLARKPRNRQELQKIQALVSAAVGLDAMRGDKLTVENVSFDEPVHEEGPPPSILEKYKPEIWEGSRIGAVVEPFSTFGGE